MRRKRRERRKKQEVEKESGQKVDVKEEELKT